MESQRRSECNPGDTIDACHCSEVRYPLRSQNSDAAFSMHGLAVGADVRNGSVPDGLLNPNHGWKAETAKVRLTCANHLFVIVALYQWD